MGEWQLDEERLNRVNTLLARADDVIIYNQGKFWLLQARRGQRTAHAAVRIALDLVDQGLVDLDGAVRRIPPSSLVRIREPLLDPAAPRTVLGEGLAASPGAAVGRVARVRPYTSPVDIAGFIAARGIVTAHGGRTSHAAVVARGMDRPAVCGVVGLEVRDGRCRFPDGVVEEGDEISIDGATGEVFAGRVPLVAPPSDPRVQALLARCDARRGIPVLVEEPVPDWADGALESDGTAQCHDSMSLAEALDDPDVRRVVLDMGAASEPAKLLKDAAAAGELNVDLLVLVDEGGPTTVRTLPSLPWRGVVAGRQGEWTARLLAAVVETTEVAT